MNNLLDMEMLGAYKGSYNTELQVCLSLRQIFALIKNESTESWSYAETAIANLNARTQDGDRPPVIQGEEKTNLPAITFGGIFEPRKTEGLVGLSGLVALDYDKLKDNKLTPEKCLMKVRNDKHFLGLYTTASQNGVRVITAVAGVKTVEDYGRAWGRAQRYFDSLLGLPCDAGTKDAARLSYISYDPAACLNEGTFKPLLLPAEGVVHINRTDHSKPLRMNTVKHDGDFPRMSEEELADRLTYIDADFYPQWFKTIGAIADAGYPADIARAYSAQSNKHTQEKFEKKWNQMLKGGSGNTYTIASIVYDSDAAGYQRPVKPKKNNRIG